MSRKVRTTFLIGVFMGLGAALFYASCEKYIVPRLFETAFPWIFGKNKDKIQ
jgi:hypothetical protein